MASAWEAHLLARGSGCVSCDVGHVARGDAPCAPRPCVLFTPQLCMVCDRYKLILCRRARTLSTTSASRLGGQGARRAVRLIAGLQGSYPVQAARAAQMQRPAAAPVPARAGAAQQHPWLAPGPAVRSWGGARCARRLGTTTAHGCAAGQSTGVMVEVERCTMCAASRAACISLRCGVEQPLASGAHGCSLTPNSFMARGCTPKQL